MVAAIADTLREAGTAPSGVIYAALMGRVSLNGYERILAMLTRAGLISIGRDHLITWIGPAARQRGCGK